MFTRTSPPYSDADFLAGEFLQDCLPRDKQYLYNYFTSDIQIAFIRYVYVFGDSYLFSEHTGVPCKPRTRQIMKRNYHDIEAAHQDAKNKMDFDLLENIEKGGFKTKRWGVKPKKKDRNIDKQSDGTD